MFMFLVFSKPGLLNQFVADLHSGKLHREFHHGPDPTPAPPAEIEVRNLTNMVIKCGHVNSNSLVCNL